MEGIDAGLFGLLKADATLMAMVTEVYSPEAPDDTEAGVTVTYPFLLFESLGGPDEYTLTQRVRTQFQYQIRIVGSGPSIQPLWLALERVDTILCDAAVTASTIYCRRERVDPPISENIDGVMFHQVLAEYRIEVL